MTQSAQIHVNQVALERGGVKKAVIVTNPGTSVSDVSVVRLDDGSRHNFDARRTKTFSEWGDDQIHYRVEFSGLEKDGIYRLEARMSDGSNIASAQFRITRSAIFRATMTDVLHYFHANRNNDERDKAVEVIDSGELVNAWGGWNDAGGDSGKYLSHLFYANFLTPQQASFVAWSMLASWERASAQFRDLDLDDQLLDEALWGCDYLCRIQDKKGYFYATVFDRWGADKTRHITAYRGIEGDYTPDYQAAFRQGGGFAIAALARAARLTRATGKTGAFTVEQYLQAAERGYHHLKENNIRYCGNSQENIIDDYCALMAAIDLYKATTRNRYMEDARIRVASLVGRMSKEGFFVADDGQRPFFHAVEAGLPLISLAHYHEVETDPHLLQMALTALETAWRHQFSIDREAANPFDYPRQQFRTFDFENTCYSSEVLTGFFIPHENETGYWWQGENARLASLAAAALISIDLFGESANPQLRELAEQLREFSQDQFDWILGKNPFGLCMLYGFGDKNPEFSKSGGKMVKGGISNGITGNKDSAEGRGIDFAAGDEDSNWRWVEQWTPHGAWFLYAASLQVMR